jgi:hypothetical protein
VTHLRKMMLEELQRRNYSEITTRKYLQYVTAFAFPALCQSSIAQADLKLASKSHSAPRPPQTPAASS